MNSRAIKAGNRHAQVKDGPGRPGAGAPQGISNVGQLLVAQFNVLEEGYLVDQIVELGLEVFQAKGLTTIIPAKRLDEGVNLTADHIDHNPTGNDQDQQQGQERGQGGPAGAAAQQSFKEAERR
jgi:hypothetical protein